MLRGDNIMYLDPSRWFPSSQDPAVHYYMSPVYAASRVFVAGALDTLLAQAYYQPQVLQVLQAGPPTPGGPAPPVCVCVCVSVCIPLVFITFT